MIETTDNHKTIIRDSLADADLFARGILRLPLHDWQGARLYGASKLGTRRRIAIRAPNGAGKDDRIIAPLSLWWLRRYAKGQVVITTKDEKQLNNQTWVSISAHKHLFGDCPTWRDHDHLIVTPTGGRLTAFVTDESSRAEGYHERKPDGPLLMIINEAREVDDEIFKAFNRCSYNLLVVISTGGLMQGKFYDAFTKDRARYETYAVTWDDCPHLSQEKKAQTLADCDGNEDDPYYQSTILGNFMRTDDSIRHILELSDIEGNRAANIGRVPGVICAGIDFAAGGDQNVIIKKVGNWVEPAWIHGWRGEPNAAIGRFAMLIHKLGLRARDLWCDADGLGIAMCSDLDAALGSVVNRFHGGSKSPHPRYKNLISYVWHEVAQKVRRHEINVPNHQELIKQLSSRRIKYSNDGKLWLESKMDLRNRGVSSPDYADAFVVAHGIIPFSARNYMKPGGGGLFDPGSFAGPFPDISDSVSENPMGWGYDLRVDNDKSYLDRRTWGSGGRGEDGGDWPAGGFGGVNCNL